MTASDHIDPFKYPLHKLKQDLLGRDLIPSRLPLKDGLDEKIKILTDHDIHNLGDLITSVKNKKKISELSARTGIDEDYLNLLRREANSYLPNPVSVDRFGVIPPEILDHLANEGIKNSRHVFERLQKKGTLEVLVNDTGINQEILEELLALSDLVRAYGVGPAFAKLLYDTGIHSISDLKRYTPQEVIELYEDQSGKKADFSASDIKFCLDLIQALDIE